MFKDKELHSGLAKLINKFVDFYTAYNASVKTISNNFEQLNDKATAGLDKLDKVYILVNKLEFFQQHVLWYEDNTKKLEAERDLLQTDNANLQKRLEEVTYVWDQDKQVIKAQAEKLAEVFKTLTLHEETEKALRTRIEELEDYAAQCDVVIHNQSLELAQLRDTLKDANEQAIKAAFAQPVQQQPIVVNNQFNMQELASELSKYLNPNPVANSGLQPSTHKQFEPFENSTPVHTHESNAAEFFRQDSQRVQRQESKVVEPLANLVVPGNGLRTSADYIPSPGQEEPDEIVVEQLVFTDPAIAQRLQTAPSGPVLLPSERQRALQLAELGAVGVLQQNQNG